MGYRIEQEGFEFQGVRLGQKCKDFKNEDAIVIGFDMEEDETSSFIMISNNSNSGSIVASKSSCVDVILSGYELTQYNWGGLKDIDMSDKMDEMLNAIDELNPPKQISPIHVADILEDTLQMAWYDQADEIREILNECIKSLRA